MSCIKKALDLFSGAGGAGLALRQAGYEVAGVDSDLAAVEVYRQAVGDCILADVRALDPATFGPVDLLWASPPCPPWSEAVRARGGVWGFEHPDGALLLEPLRWAEALRPRWTIIENVDGLPEDVIADLVGGIGKIFPKVTVLRLDASGFVPQKRGHVFIVGGPRQVPPPTPVLPTPRFGDIMDGKDAIPVGAQHLKYALRKRAFMTPVVSPDSILPTVTTRPFHGRWTCFVIDRPGQIRFPTFLEAMRAQGFPDDHPLHALYVEHPAAAWRLLGNAVPVPLARGLILSLELGDDGPSLV